MHNGYLFWAAVQRRRAKSGVQKHTVCCCRGSGSFIVSIQQTVCSALLRVLNPARRPEACVQIIPKCDDVHKLPVLLRKSGAFRRLCCRCRLNCCEKKPDNDTRGARATAIIWSFVKSSKFSIGKYRKNNF